MKKLFLLVITCFGLLTAGCNEPLDPLPGTNSGSVPSGGASVTFTKVYYGGRNAQGTCLLRVDQHFGVVTGQFLRPGAPPLYFLGHVAVDGSLSGKVDAGGDFDGVASTSRASFWQFAGSRCEIAPITPPFGAAQGHGTLTIQTFTPDAGYNGPNPLLQTDQIATVDEMVRMTVEVRDQNGGAMSVSVLSREGTFDLDQFLLVYTAGDRRWSTNGSSQGSYEMQRVDGGWRLTFDVDNISADSFMPSDAAGSFHLGASLDIKL